MTRWPVGSYEGVALFEDVALGLGFHRIQTGIVFRVLDSARVVFESQNPLTPSLNATRDWPRPGDWAFGSD